MPQKLKKFLALDARLKGLFVKAFFLLGWFRWQLRLKSLKELVQLSGISGKSPNQEAGESPPLASDIGWAIRTAAAHTPWESSCLVQVLAAQRMLQTQGIGGSFFIGTALGDEQGEPGFHAHAWLMCGGEFITGEAGHERFTVLSEFSWG